MSKEEASLYLQVQITISLLFNYYAYIDTEEFLADSVFIQEKLRVFFGKTGKKQDCQYIVVMCKIWKRDTEKFVHAMEKLYNKLLLLGHEEYEDFFEMLGGKGESQVE